MSRDLERGEQELANTLHTSTQRLQTLERKVSLIVPQVSNNFTLGTSLVGNSLLFCVATIQVANSDGHSQAQSSDRGLVEMLELTLILSTVDVRTSNIPTMQCMAKDEISPPAQSGYICY